MVHDAINHRDIDYRWSRMKIDKKLYSDITKLCRTAATPPIPPGSDALMQCESTNVPQWIGAETLYDFVDNYGDLFFDADLTKPGTQEILRCKAPSTPTPRPPLTLPTGKTGAGGQPAAKGPQTPAAAVAVVKKIVLKACQISAWHISVSGHAGSWRAVVDMTLAGCR